MRAIKLLQTRLISASKCFAFLCKRTKIWDDPYSQNVASMDKKVWKSLSGWLIRKKKDRFQNLKKLFKNYFSRLFVGSEDIGLEFFKLIIFLTASLSILCEILYYSNTENFLIKFSA